MNATGPYSAGNVLPSNIGAAGSGSFEQGTKGWSFEVTWRANQEGDRTQWAKVVNLGTSSQQRAGRCNGEWLVGWESNSDEVSMGTCLDGDENKLNNFIRDAPDNTWIHIVSVIQSSPHGWSTYSVYYNGVLAARRSDSNPLVNTYRDAAWLGRSSWGNDAYFNGSIDVFSVYDIALTPVMVAGLYGEKMNGCTVSRAPYANATVDTAAVAPAIAAAFTSDITRSAGGNPDFEWLQQDPEDVPCGVAPQHQGLLKLAGDADYRPSFSAGPFVNLSATTGENFIGQTFPTFGGITTGQGVADSTAGFSVEVSFKASFQNPAAKLFSIGNADAEPCVPGDFWGGWRQSSYSMELMFCEANTATPPRGEARPIVVRGVPLRVRTWYHMVVSIVGQSNGAATWKVYLNGQLVAVSQNLFFPSAGARKNVLLGRSLFLGTTDTYFSGVVDHFNIYNRALTGPQVAALASASGFQTCTQGSNNQYLPPTPFYRIGFDNNPTPAGVTPSYTWMEVDTNDTAIDQQNHRGIVLLGPGAGGRNVGQFINLTATSGPNSVVGQPLGWFGGEGRGPYLESRKGWTFSAVFKILRTPTTTIVTEGSNNTIVRNGQDWAKVYDIGDGNKGNRDQCENDVIFGFDGGNNWMKFQACNPVNNVNDVGNDRKMAMEVNKWYHSLVTLALTPTGPLASYWLNGELVERKNIPNMPLFASRQDGRLGGSSWPADPQFNGMIELFAIYDEAVNDFQASYIYAQAMSQTLPIVPSSTGGENPDGPNGAASVSITVFSALVVIVAAMLL